VYVYYRLSHVYFEFLLSVAVANALVWLVVAARLKNWRNIKEIF
jgi:hypothetical protein